ncbi:MAG: hypothetical protein WBA42_00905 [Mesorhizobium sp.]
MLGNLLWAAASIFLPVAGVIAQTRSIAPPTSPPGQFDRRMKRSEGQHAIQSFYTFSVIHESNNSQLSLTQV